MRADHSGCCPVTQTKLENIFFNCVKILHYFAEPATTKCKPVAVLQLSSTLMTGQTRTNFHQLSSKFEPVQSRLEWMRVGGQTLCTQHEKNYVIFRLYLTGKAMCSVQIASNGNLNVQDRRLINTEHTIICCVCSESFRAAHLLDQDW